MKNILLILLMWSSFCPNIYSQKDKNINISEAVNFLNIFLNNENWATKVTGGFTYNNYSKTLLYESKSVGKDNKKTTIEDNYILNLSNVSSINENIHTADKNKTGDSNLMTIDILLKNEIYRSLNRHKEGDVIPNYNNSQVKKVWFAIEKRISNDDVESIRNALRDIFQNIPIQTEYF